MMFDALRRTTDVTLAAVRNHADTLDRIVAELPDRPDRDALLDRLRGRPSEEPS